MGKREEEEIILRKVLGDIGNLRIIHSERPDFILEDPEDRAGVEVTELHYSSSQARINKHPDYINRILKGGEFMDKRDVSELGLKKLQILENKPGPVENLKTVGTTRGILVELPSWPEYACMVIDKIYKKEKQKEGYDKTLKDIFLIIEDKSGGKGHNQTLESFVRNFYLKDLLTCLKSTTFKELFLVVPVDPKNGRDIIVSLKKTYTDLL